MSKTYSAGIVTAYGAAKRAGYQGTYEDFCRQQAEYAENTAAVERAKQDAQTARDQAQTARTEAVNAKDSAVSAKNDAVSAKNTAVSAKDDAVSAKNTATTKAQEARASATSAGQSAQSADQSARSAEQSAQDISGNLEQIQTNKEDISQLKADLAGIVQADYLFNDSFNKSERIASGQFTNQNATIESDLPCTGGSVLYVTYNVNVTVNPNIFSSLTLQCVEYDANNNVLKRTFDFDNPLTLKTNTTHIALHITYSYNNTESRYTEIFTGNISVRNGGVTLNEDIIIPQISNMIGTDGEAW